MTLQKDIAELNTALGATAAEGAPGHVAGHTAVTAEGTVLRCVSGPGATGCIMLPDELDHDGCDASCEACHGTGVADERPEGDAA